MMRFFLYVLRFYWNSSMRIEIMMMTLDGYMEWNLEFTSTGRDFNDFLHATISLHNNNRG